jgi:hypothetical protein
MDGRDGPHFVLGSDFPELPPSGPTSPILPGNYGGAFVLKRIRSIAVVTPP